MDSFWPAIVGLALGVFVAYWFSSRQVLELKKSIKERTRQDELILEEARREAGRLLDEAASRGKLDALSGERELEALRKTSALEAEARLTKATLEAEAQVAKARLEAESALARARLEASELGRRKVAEAEAEGRALAERLRAVEEERCRAEEARLAGREASLLEKERSVSGRDAEIGRKDREVSDRERRLIEREAESITLVSQQRSKLEAIAGLSGDEARRRLMAEFVDEARRLSAREAKQVEDAAREEAEKRAKRIVGIAIQRYAGEHVQERAVTSVHLPSDEMKGRIIGREGRNIRALQEALGVDFIVDDTPETIVISSFDPVRREVARLSLEKLLADGRIHPTRIEEVVGRAREEVERAMDAAATSALDELGVVRVHPELARLVGQLRYRYSYAQNVLKHSVECGYVAGLLAGELGLNTKLARRAGLLHDLGKAVSHEVDGGHAVVGGRLARKHGEEEIVANAISCHHDDEPSTSVYGHLVTAADALSGARPGARREMLESYVRRLSDLEKISNTFAGVERSYAIQAGREVRVLVEPGEVNDEEAALLAREISRRIEEELVYPGQIKVTVVRETRAVDYAK